MCYVCKNINCDGECLDILRSAPCTSKHHKKETVGRPGRLYKAEKQYCGNSSMAPRKDHDGKGPTLRSHRGVNAQETKDD